MSREGRQKMVWDVRKTGKEEIVGESRCSGSNRVSDSTRCIFLFDTDIVLHLACTFKQTPTNKCITVFVLQSDILLPLVKQDD